MNILTGILPLLFGFLLDCLLGDPYSLPHPVRLIGKTISLFERFFRKLLPRKEILGGFLLWISVVIVSTGIPLVILILCYHISRWAGIAMESIFCYYLMAPKCLHTESMKVFYALEQHDIAKARNCVAMIVGRDTAVLDEKGIVKATVETIAENTSDGVTAPLFYMTFGGAVSGFLYKAVNTMDSMLGYKNEKYLYFGKFSAKADDIFNFIPSRMTALLMIISARIIGLDGKHAFQIWLRDRLNHTSPNSAQTEAVCAGALHVRLGGDAYYFGKLCHKPTIGDDDREIQNVDIRKTNRLMYCTTLITLLFSVIVRTLLLLSVNAVFC